MKIRLTDTAIDYRAFGIVIPYVSIHDIKMVIELSRPDASVNDCVWIQIDPDLTGGFGFLASRAMVKKTDGSVWLPVGIVGQREYKGALFSELAKRVSLPKAQSLADKQPSSDTLRTHSRIQAEEDTFLPHTPSASRTREGAGTSAFSDDPIAMRLDWAPMRNSGASFRTRRLVAADKGRVEFRATMEAKGWYIYILIFGFVGLIINLCGLSIMPTIANVCRFSLPGLLFSIVLGGFGGFRLYLEAVPVIFDKKAGLFRKGRKEPEAIVELSKIHALQLVSKYFSGKNQSFYSYELNLVLKNGSRLNVINSGDGAALKKDAETLAAFLGVPVWNMT